jgi:hypothetical protein
MRIKVSTEFSRFPGPRYKEEGKHSGEEFRTSILFPRVQEAIRLKKPVLIDLDGTFGYGTSFLEEAFGGLIRNDGLRLEDIRSAIVLVSTEEPDLVKEIREYLEKAADEELGH